MDAVNAFLDALVLLLTTRHFFYLIGGVLLGMSIGVLPGLGGIVGFSIMLPFIYGMDPVSALALLIGLVAVIPTSDTFASVLLGIPGSSASQATVLDGFALAKKGQAARALSSAFSSSLLGGLFGAMILTIFIVVARPLVLLFGSAELFMLGVLGISMVGVLSGKSITKGFAACALGLLLGSIGNAPATGEWRMAFDSSYLYDGIRLVLVGLAAFALPEVVELLRKNTAISSTSLLGSGWIRGLKDTWLYKWIVLRCATIGVIIGALPGLGGSVVDWIAYGNVVQTARDKSQFGKGDIRGVIAPESANNAKEGGGLIPTLLFAIPGSGSMAVFLGGLTILGIEAGPTMVRDNLDITYVIIWSLALANVAGTILCICLSGQIARLTTIPYGFLAPFLIIIISFAAFQATKSFWDLFTLLMLGTFCVFMKRFDWPRPALLIGFVLADTLETYLYQAVQFYSWGFFTRTGVIIIFLFTFISVLGGSSTFRSKIKRKNTTTEDKGLNKDALNMKTVNADSQQSSIKNTTLSQDITYDWLRSDVIFTAAVLAFCVFALFDSLQHSFLGSVFPFVMSLVGIGASATLLLKLIFKPVGIFHDSEVTMSNEDGYDKWGAYKSLAWIYGLVVATFFFGFIIAITMFFLILMSFKTQASWIRKLIITCCGVGGVITLAHFMNLDFPWGLLQKYTELPWPLG